MQKNQGQESVDSKDRVEENEQTMCGHTDGLDRSHAPFVV